MVFHALNRGVDRVEIFSTERDYEAFEETIEETLRLYPMRILAYCLMPTHCTSSCGLREIATCPLFSSD